MAKDNFGLLLSALVGIVAVVGLVILFSGQMVQKAPVVVFEPVVQAPAPVVRDPAFGEQYTPTPPPAQLTGQSCLCRNGRIGMADFHGRCLC